MNYIFITPSIVNIGGAEKYIYGKTDFLIRNGHQVTIFSYMEGQKILRFESDSYLHKELRFSPRIYRKQKLQWILELLESEIQVRDSKETLIETSTIALAEWGEILARKIGAKHFCFCLEENFNITRQTQYSFLKFKLERGELAGINKLSVPKMLSSFETMDNGAAFVLSAASADPVGKCEVQNKYLLQECRAVDYVIGSIGRTDKVLFKTLLAEVQAFAKKNDTRTFLLIFIGGPDVDNSMLKKYERNNLLIRSIGYCFPIPLELLEKMDVNISTSGSVRVSARYDIPTISTSAKDASVLGIYNYTTLNTLFSENENEPRQDMEDYLSKILFDKYCENHEKIEKMELLKQGEIDEKYKQHLMYLEKSKGQRTYYPIEEIVYNQKEKVIKLLISVFGVDGANYVASLASSIKRK